MAALTVPDDPASHYSSLARALAAIDQAGPEQVATGALRHDLRWFATQQRALEAMSARWLAELDRREKEAADDERRSPVRFLCDSLGLTANAAQAWLRTARALDTELRLTAGALRRGEIGAQQVGVIRRAVEAAAKTCLDPAAVESELVEAARGMDAYALERHWQQLRYRADQAAGEAAEEEERRRSWLSLRQHSTGSYRVEGVLDAVCGASLHTALRAIMGRKAKDDERTPEQRRAAARGELARRCLDAGDLPERGGERPHLSLVAQLGTLRLEPGSPVARLDWGPLVTGRTARLIAEDASVAPVLVDGGEIVHAGRRSRVVPAPVRRALNLRDGGCRAPGCTMPPDLCSPHHKKHWVDGGEHRLPNLDLRCDAHHARLHPENERFRSGR